MVDITTECPYNNLDMDIEEIRRHLAEAQREKEILTQNLKAINSVEEGYEKLLVLAESASQPLISLRAALLQVLRASQGEMLHVKEVLQQVEAMGARVRSANNDKVSRVDVGIYGLKKQGFPVERVGTRTWKYLGGETVDFKAVRTRKNRQRKKDEKIGGEARR